MLNVLLWNALWMWNVLFLLQLTRPRRFYLTVDMTKLYLFIQFSLEWLFSKLCCLMYCYGNNTNILHLTFFLAEV